VLTNWKAKDIVTVGKFETIANKINVIFGIHNREGCITLPCLGKPEPSSPGEILSICLGPRVWNELLSSEKNENRQKETNLSGETCCILW